MDKRKFKGSNTSETRPDLTRKTLCSDELIDLIRDSLMHGMFIKDACATVGMNWDTHADWMKKAEISPDKYPQCVKYSDMIKKALANSEKFDLQVITKAAMSGQWQASAWRLERRFPNKWGRKERLDLTSSDGSNKAVTQVIVKMRDNGRDKK